MVYDLSRWFYARSKLFWVWWSRRRGLGRLFTLAPVALLWAACALVALVFLAASWATLLEKTAAGLFFLFQRRIGAAGLVGKVFWLPFLLSAMLICLGVVVLSIGNANPFSRK